MKRRKSKKIKNQKLDLNESEVELRTNKDPVELDGSLIDENNKELKKRKKKNSILIDQNRRKIRSQKMKDYDS